MRSHIRIRLCLLQVKDIITGEVDERPVVSEHVHEHDAAHNWHHHASSKSLISRSQSSMIVNAKSILCSPTAETSGSPRTSKSVSPGAGRSIERTASGGSVRCERTGSAAQQAADELLQQVSTDEFRRMPSLRYVELRATSEALPRDNMLVPRTDEEEGAGKTI